MQVLKFGGTSVATPKNIELIRKILDEKTANSPVVVVVSAFGGITTLLLECGKQAAGGDENYSKPLAEITQRHIQMVKSLIGLKNQGKTLSKIRILLNELEDIYRGIYLIRELSPKTIDRILSFGEIASSTIINDAFQDKGYNCRLANCQELIKTNSQYTRAQLKKEETYKRIRKHFRESEASVTFAPGFIGSDDEGNTTTLGRGGSDFTAAIFAAALKVKQLEIWTDVSGMMTADPRIVRSAYVIRQITYEEAMELSHFGAKVIYPPTIQPVMEHDIPVLIKNTFHKDDPGTIITRDVPAGEDRLIRGLSSISNIALLNFSGSGMIGVPEYSHRFFKALSAASVNVILITQASSEHSICVGISMDDAKNARQAIESEFQVELHASRIDPLLIEENLSIVALVGSSMKEQVGVSGKMFSTLGQNGVNIKAIAQGSSEKNISVVIESNEVKKALNSLHESFFLSDKKKLNLFIIGVGNVGKAFLSQIKKQRSYLSKYHHVDLCVAALANSKKMYFESSGISLSNWERDLKEKGSKMNLKKFLEEMDTMNLRNSIFIDNTADEMIANCYEDVLKMSISVVTPNKIACTQSIEKFISLKKTGLRYKSKFLYETNVGAGLPVISTLSDLIKSGDEINRIEAVLSGSLNFIFNNYNGERPFAEIVKQAMSEGYTEPDPRIDLSGIDVKRKILILIRESVINMEMEDITTIGFIPETCMNAPTVDAFLSSLLDHEDHFRALYQKADKSGKKLKYVASFNKGKAETGIRMIERGHPFYQLEGKDNIVTFNTRRYPEQPLVIKGAGAGADVTASGIFADIMRIANS
ncbi:bifunctional aspartate kinase/homoserine dehydrogenase I [Fulvivirga sedimenti]|uniref:Bifunctional aspartate kinase/homoserine dehydrogenase I n=1 Tax=Fulvivirga sedimenti TaxID=2879465 RepID=A0A9X1HWS7_9BACT|nr:bifunctional aspartate kinase/homoserine dehydrogenase I [Fulvivirga sedimenti]MCA6078222.1 bifunctional aspartate kinase/homoserine dehydrogenase I [Fulvivirga sedimenti]